MRTLGRLVLVVLVLGVLLGVTFYLRPLWVFQQGTHFGLFLSRVQSNYVLTPEGRVHYYVEAEPRIPGGGHPDCSWCMDFRRPRCRLRRPC